MAPSLHDRPLEANPRAELPRMIAAAAEPLPDPGDPGFGALFDRFAKARLVLLGEASHGTSEFYRARAAIDDLDRVDPAAGRVARERYGCLTPWAHAPQAYGRKALTAGFRACEAAVARMLSDMLSRRLDYAEGDSDSFLDATANARLVRNAEAYYRVMYYGAAASWNLRDTHMFET